MQTLKKPNLQHTSWTGDFYLSECSLFVSPINKNIAVWFFEFSTGGGFDE